MKGKDLEKEVDEEYMNTCKGHLKAKIADVKRRMRHNKKEIERYKTYLEGNEEELKELLEADVVEYYEKSGWADAVAPATVMKLTERGVDARGAYELYRQP